MSTVGMRLAERLKDLALGYGKLYSELLLDAADELERNEEWQKMAYDNGYSTGFKSGFNEGELT